MFYTLLPDSQREICELAEALNRLPRIKANVKGAAIYITTPLTFFELSLAVVSLLKIDSGDKFGIFLTEE